MEFILVSTGIVVVIGIIGAFTWAHVTKNKDSAKKFFNIYESITFYGLVFVALGVTFYYYLN